MSIIEDIKNFLKTLSKVEQNDFMRQLLAEKELQDAFRGIGFVTSEIPSETLSESARQRPKALLSLLEKVDLVDVINTINLIKLIEVIDTISTIENVGSIALLARITQLDKLNPQSSPERITNGGFEDFWTGWDNYGSEISYTEFHSGSQSCYQYYSQHVDQTFATPIDVSTISTFIAWFKRGAGNGVEYVSFTVDGITKNSVINIPNDGNWHEVDLLAKMVEEGLTTGSFTKFSFIRMDDNFVDYWIDDVSLVQSYNAVIDLVKEIVKMPAITGTVQATGSENQPLLQRALTYELLVQLRHAGVEIDPRAIRLLTASDIVDLALKGTVLHFSLTATGDVKVPATDKALQILGWFYYSSADITTELRFKTSTNVIAGLTKTGACGMNLIGKTPPQGAINETVEMYLSNTGTVKGWINFNEV